jgi:uncharacterized Zn finger protein (UPF0148 family)
MPDWKNLKDKAMAAVNSAAQEVDHQLTLTKLRAEVNQAQADLDKALQNLGAVVHEGIRRNQPVDPHDPSIAAAMNQIDDRKQRVAAAQQALTAGSAEESATHGSHCPACGAAVADGAKFCPSCGHAVT